MESVLGPNLAGTWYPADAQDLRETIRRLIEEAGPADRNAPPVRALIEPHAGYMYSGPVAAAGFRLVDRRRFRRVILAGPSHHLYFKGVAVPRANGYRTPLGTVPLDRDRMDAWTGVSGFRFTDQPFEPEHCLEIEIPFLQTMLEPGWKLVPLLVGNGLEPGTEEEVIGAIRTLADPETLLVASSDFTHYGADFRYLPFQEQVQDRLEELDLGAVREITDGDRDRFRRYVERTGATICGRHAIDLLLGILPTGGRWELAAYDTSGRITGDWAHTVSYAALAFRDGGADG